MAYVRPANPVEVNPDNALMPDGKFYLLGTSGYKNTDGDSQQWRSIGKNPGEGNMVKVGDWSKITEGFDFTTIAPNPSSASLRAGYSPNFNEQAFTRLFVFDMSTPNNGYDIYNSSTSDAGGYVNGSLRIVTIGNATVLFQRSNQASLGQITGLVTGINVLAIAHEAGGAFRASLNGGDTVELTASALGIGPDNEMFGQHQFLGENNQGITLRFYGWANNVATAAQLKSLSTTPMQVVRTAGSTTPVEPPPSTDTDPPGLITLGTNVEGTKVILSADETLKNQFNLASMSFSNGKTPTAVTISGSIAEVTITPAVELNETGLTMSYVASAQGFVDEANNQLPSFSNQVVSNNVGAGFWKFLGNEGETVTVPAGTRVRYGITGAYVEKTMSGTFAITNTEFTDPAPGSIKHADSFVNGVATGYTLSGPAMGPVGESGLFTLSVDGLVAGDLIITPAATGLTFSPSTVVLNNNAMTATFSAIATAAGDYSITLTNNKNFTNPAAKAYKAITSIFRTFGTGGDSPDLGAAITAVGSVSPAQAKIMVVLEGLDDVATAPIATINPLSADESYYYLIRPVKAKRFDEINRAGALHESMAGAQLNISAGQFELGGGVVIEGYKLNITAADGLKFGAGGAGPDAKLRKCFVLANADRAMVNQAYKSSALEDTFIIRTSAHTDKMFNASWVLKIDRCTWYNKTGNAAKAHDGGWGNGAYIKDSAYVGFQANPILQPEGFGKSNNVSTSAMSNMDGFTVDTTNAAFISATNYRAGPALINKAGPGARSTNDVLGNNRGPNPDAGAAQGTAAMPLATGTVTSQPDPDGNRVTGFFTTTGTVTSATVTLEAIDEGLTVGPLTITVAGGTGSYQIDGVMPGGYKAPRVGLTNAGGTGYVEGFVPFEIAGVGGGPVDPGVQVAATAVVWSGPAGGTVGVESVAYTVGLNGSYAGTVRVTPSDANQSGQFNPAYVDLVNGGSGSFTYTPASAGTKSISLTNDKSLQNPNPMNYVVSAPQVIVAKVVLPLTTDGTTPVGPMADLQYAWFDQPLPTNFTAPKLKGNNGAIADGAFELILTGSVLKAGDTGYLVLSNTSGDVAQSPAALVFSGSVKVQ